PGCAVRCPGIREDRAEAFHLGLPVGDRPVGAVEMAAGMAGDLVAFPVRLPDMAEPDAGLVTGLGETDIGAPGLVMRPLVEGGIGPRDDQRAGEEIGEAGIGRAGEIAAALPERIVAGAVEG